MRQITDLELLEVVRKCRCQACDGMGFRLVPVEDDRGERTGEKERIDCRVCDGNGIRLSLCRRLAAELVEKALAGG
jgi:hypothetical protein